MATNILRSSFVTHFYSSDEAQDPVLRESVATVMRHSVDQALRVYDQHRLQKAQGTPASRFSSTAVTAEPSPTVPSPTASQCSKRTRAVLCLPEEQTPKKPASVATVVLFQRVPHQVIRELEANGDRMLLLGKMTRSLSSNEPVYFPAFCPPTLSSTSSRATTASFWRASGMKRVASSPSDRPSESNRLDDIKRSEQRHSP